MAGVETDCRTTLDVVETTGFVATSCDDVSGIRMPVHTLSSDGFQGDVPRRPLYDLLEFS